MCGIAGFFDADASFLSNEEQYQILLAKMGRTLKHRGPDASGTLLCNRCGLAHRRLSIIDITGGAQPMSKIYSDYHYHIVYNGEIYNTDDLRHKLTTLGVHFKTTSDTEVLLLGFIHFGPSFIQDVDGIFALAVYDERHETLTLFRDCFGVKPLFYTQTGNTFVFASELKGLFCYPGIAPAVDSNGLNEIFSLGPAHTPGCGVYKNVHEVLPGSYLSVSRAGVRETTYFRLESHPHEDSYETTIATVRELLTGAIRRQMISDVPICTFLSGGIDSSLVSSVCAGELKKEGRQLKTFSFDFTDNENYFQSNSFQPSMDKPYAAKMASYLNSHHTYLECTNQTQAEMDLYGVSQVTALARDRGYVILEGQQIDNVKGFYKNVVGGRAGVTEYYMYDATNLRLREVSLSYNFPKEWMQKTKVLKNVQLSFVARNLCFLYKEAPFDPDLVLSTGNDNQGIEVFGMPTTRSLGFTLKCEF